MCVVWWEGRDMIVCGGWVGCDCVCSVVGGGGYDVCGGWVGCDCVCSVVGGEGYDCVVGGCLIVWWVGGV